MDESVFQKGWWVVASTVHEVENGFLEEHDTGDWMLVKVAFNAPAMTVEQK